MKVTIRTVTGTTLKLDFEPDTKILDVKAAINQAQPSLPADALNVIYQGKILKDDATLEESKVTETGFIVVMVIKKKAEAAPSTAGTAATSAAPAAAAVPAAETPPVATETQPAEVPAAAPAAAEPSAAAAEAAPPAGEYQTAASAMATGSELDSRVAAIVDMGFPEDEVKRALRAAFNNPERAVEYLMTGIPAGLEEAAPAVPRPAAGPAGAEQASAGSGDVAAAPAGQEAGSQPFDMFAPSAGGEGGETGHATPLGFLRSNQQFQMLRAMVQQNPSLLQPMLQELGRNNPALLELINANQAEFLAMINEPAPSGQPDLASLVQHLAAEYGGDAGAGDDEAMDEAGLPPGANVVEVHLSQEEAEAVERLVGLGFDRQICLEAFLICDKNEALAANYLLENGDDA